ncbi:hypothetical protein RCL_jg5824.t1 [Rhizophagus clarus]|uniref:Uncharacterized protein n=1 Tax=Rhizophagus clarus TaxID=94130 RepID=A0A8H3LWQ0_9GLOM|nr:hypothetical protein RCL_jg5824.t1 [Rhizophagus clarus]
MTRYSNRRNQAQKRRDLARAVRRHNQVRENLSYDNRRSLITQQVLANAHVTPTMALVTGMLGQNSPPLYNEVIGVEPDQNGLWRCRSNDGDRDVLISCSRNNWCPIMDYIMNAHGSSFIDISPFRRRSSRTPKGRRVLRR